MKAVRERSKIVARAQNLDDQETFHLHSRLHSGTGATCDGGMIMECLRHRESS